MEVEGHRIRYWEAGSGPPLLLVHGLGNSALTWRSNLEALGERFHAIAVDLPGHGLSDMPRQRFGLSAAARFLGAFMDAIGEPSAYVVGNSMGGVVALELALVEPERVRALVLVDSVGLGKEIALFLRLGSVPGIGEYYERPNQRRIANMCRAMLYDHRFLDDEVVAEMLRYRKRSGAPRALLRFLRTGVNIFGQRPAIDRSASLASLRMPLLVLWGQQDRLVPVTHAQAVSELCPNAQVHIFDRCGHWPQVEHAEEFNRLVASFLSDGAAGRESRPISVQEPPRPAPADGETPPSAGVAAAAASQAGPVTGDGTAGPAPYGGVGLQASATLAPASVAGLQPGRGEFWVQQKHLRILALAVVVGIIVVAVLYRDRLTDPERIAETLGYTGIFIISLTGSGAIVLPLPSTAAIFAGGVFLTPIYVGLVAGVAEAMGEVTGYALGYGGQGLVENSRFYRRIERWLKRRGGLAIMLFSIIPNPLFDLLGVAAGALRYPLLRFLFYAWIGKTIKDIGLAYAGFLGASWVVSLTSSS